jgi:Plasmid encoded RepA protein
MTDDTKYKPLTRAQSKLIDASVLIFGEAATKKDAAFIARELVQASLPHKNPGDVPAWTRRNGNLTLAIQPGWNHKTAKSYGYPYGTIPRLLLFWVTTETLRTNCRRLELGSSLSGFMAELGLSAYTGRGKRGDAKRLRDQMERLFRCRISFETLIERGGRKGEAGRDMLVTEDRMLWWDEKRPDQAALWGSWVELGEKFYQAINAAPVPVDIRAIKALKRSPLALDLYSWLTYEAFRAHKSAKARYETWTQLEEHIGGNYTGEDGLGNFRKKTKAALRKIQNVYPGLKLSKKQGGIEILPESYPALQPRHVTLDRTCKTL